MRLADKIAFVTGAAGGIGSAIVALFRAEGARVVATDLTAPALPCDLALQLDVTDEGEWLEALATAERQFGRLDILVNNAGVALTKPITSTTLAEWHRVMAVNLDGTFLGVREGMKRLAPGGAIVNLASVAALVGAPPLAAYSAAKGAVVALTRSAALAAAEAGQGLRINALCPGFTDTAMLDAISADLGQHEVMKAKLARRQPLGRLCTPEEIAEAALYLASPAARYVTGTTLAIDGGYSAQ
jgi:NAD(P)-dependent dehydrogenase (short-subunit alcohol dehydrogenase family)